MGLFRMAKTSLNGGHAEVSELFSQYSKLPAIAGLLVVSLPLAAVIGVPAVGLAFLLREGIGGAGIFVAVLLAVVPMVCLGMTLYFAQAELALNDQCGPIDAIKIAFSVCRGQWLSVIAESLLIGLAAMASVLALCVGIIPGAAFSMVVVVALYLTLRNGSGSPPL
jgi:hypothetical protein